MLLDVAESCRRYPDRGTRAGTRSSAMSLVLSHSTQRPPRLLVGDEDHEVAPSGRRRTGRWPAGWASAGVAAGLAVDNGSRENQYGSASRHRRRGSGGSPPRRVGRDPLLPRSGRASRAGGRSWTPTGSPGRLPGGSAGSSGRRSHSCRAGCRGRDRRGRSLADRPTDPSARRASPTPRSAVGRPSRSASRPRARASGGRNVDADVGVGEEAKQLGAAGRRVVVDDDAALVGVVDQKLRLWSVSSWPSTNGPIDPVGDPRAARP